MGLPRQEYCHFLLQGISLTQEEELNVSYQWKLVETSGNQWKQWFHSLFSPSKIDAQLLLQGKM